MTEILPDSNFWESDTRAAITAKPDDILVVTFAMPLAVSERSRLKDEIAASLPPQTHVVVLDRGGVISSVIRRATST